MTFAGPTAKLFIHDGENAPRRATPCLEASLLSTALSTIHSDKFSIVNVFIFFSHRTFRVLFYFDIFFVRSKIKLHTNPAETNLHPKKFSRQSVSAFFRFFSLSNTHIFSPTSGHLQPPEQTFWKFPKRVYQCLTNPLVNQPHYLGESCLINQHGRFWLIYQPRNPFLAGEDVIRVSHRHLYTVNATWADIDGFNLWLHITQHSTLRTACSSSSRFWDHFLPVAWQSRAGLGASCSKDLSQFVKLLSVYSPRLWCLRWSIGNSNNWVCWFMRLVDHSVNLLKCRVSFPPFFNHPAVFDNQVSWLSINQN